MMIGENEGKFDECNVENGSFKVPKNRGDERVVAGPGMAVYGAVRVAVARMLPHSQTPQHSISTSIHTRVPLDLPVLATNLTS